MQKIFCSILFFVLSFIFSFNPVAAQAEFATHSQATYRLDENGNCFVTRDFSIKNLTPSTYITNYALQLSSLKLENIQAFNEGEAIEPYVTTKDDITTIAFSFPNPVIGEGKSRSFGVSFESPVFANLKGNVLELNIPAQALAEGETNSINIDVPKKFGKVYRAQPPNDEFLELDNFYRYTYRNLKQTSIFLVFGKKQAYDVTLKYDLVNNTPKLQYVDIPLPPDTTYQQVRYNHLDPKPAVLKVDQDGNWLAKYYLEPNSTTIVTAQINVQVYLEPQTTGLEVLATSQHLKPDEYWTVTEQQILELLGGNNTTEAIYQTVTKTLDYTDQDIVDQKKRLGAAGVLSQPQEAVCQEFTDLFIALARSQGIPARRAVGYAFSNQEEFRPLAFEGDVLHTWPEFFDAQTNSWKPVDPTWEDTTGGVDYFNHFDLNHIVFVYNGVSSTQPLPPGSYQQKFLNQKTITVNLSSDPPEEKPNLTTEFIPFQLLGIKLPFYQLTINNQTGKAWYNLTNSFKNDRAEAVESKWFSDTLNDYILPFEQETYKVVFLNNQNTPSLENLNLKIDLPANLFYEKKQTVITIPKHWLSAYFFWQMAGLATSVTLVTGSLLVFKQRRASALRRQSQELKKPGSKLFSN